MKHLSLNEIRTQYLDFFEQRGHNRLKSYSLVPEGDDSLLLINAGMAPLKPYFLGEKKMNGDRATSSQRCVRTQDIDNVGKTHRHATFFEMLGNFSFGNYFKKDAIHWAWEFLTGNIELEPDRLWISVYENDDEAYRIWTEEIGVPAEHMMRLGKEDNFWELDQGPCGPCSEIHYDRGPRFGEGSCPADNSDRFMEIWNLVFTQFNRMADGSYVPLQHPNIDTGMGLERIALVCEEAHNIFELSVFQPIRSQIEELSGKKYGSSQKADESIRVIMDHTKALTFLVFDGVVPSNEGRGYVLRRLLRRAYRHGKLLGIEGEFLTKVIDRVIACYRPEYPELEAARERIYRVVVREEANFQQTIEQGLHMLEQIVREHKKDGLTVLSGEDAFRLYDTYGFPLDLTREILEENRMTVDEAVFEEHMLRQRQQSRERRQGGAGWSDSVEWDIEGLRATTFTGYDGLEQESLIQALYVQGARVDAMKAGEEGLLVLDRTPFYAQSGGQVADLGTLSAGASLARVEEVTKNPEGIFFHQVCIEKGELRVGGRVHAAVEADRRNDIRRNHSATHLLHRALREVLGEHVHQSGSHVDDHRLRFDFTHFEAMTPEELARVEAMVNRAIFDSYPVDTRVMSLQEATEEGAIGLFEDKYGDEVRVVRMGDFSMELCGGTHVSNTAQIQMMRILSEQGISSGVRRIEAITGRACYRQVLEYDQQLEDVAKSLKTNRTQISERIAQWQEEERQLRRRLDQLSALQTGVLADELGQQAQDVEGVSVIAARMDQKSMEELTSLADTLKDGRADYCIVLASEKEGKVLFVAAVAKSVNQRGIQAGQLVKMVAQATGGNGGGRPDFATAGGKDAAKVGEALDKVTDWVRSNLK